MKNTKILGVNTLDIKEAAMALKKGKTVVFPTETVYGLGANGLCTDAVKNIYRAKGRPSDNPLILHVAEYSWIEKLARNIPQELNVLFNTFWPGPLTVVLEANTDIIPSVTLGGLDTVAIRIPGHPLAIELLKEADVPVAAPSANSSGRPSPTEFEHVLEDLDGKVDYIIRASGTEIGIESTVLDLTGYIPKILRPGSLTYEELRDVIELEPFKEHIGGPVLSPGIKYRHYQPKATMEVFIGHNSKTLEKMKERIGEINKINQFKNIGILCYEENIAEFPPSYNIISMGPRRDLKALANSLYNSLRKFDALGVDYIISQGIEKPQGLGIAIMNRLMKACGNNIRKV